MSALLSAPSVAAALTWSVSDPVPSPAPDTLAPIAQDWLAGEAREARWSAPVTGPIDVRAVTHAAPGGTIYATSVFESPFTGSIAIRVRSDAAFRVWLDGRLIGGRATAQRWKAAPMAVPAAVESGAHRLLVELRPAFDRSASLAAVVTTPDGTPIIVKHREQAPVRVAAMPSAPVAIQMTAQPPATLPSQIWGRPPPSAIPTIAAPPPPDLNALSATPRWPDADWSLLSDAHLWILDRRHRARRVVGRVNAPSGLAPALAFLRGFDNLWIIGSDGPEPAQIDQIGLGVLFMATKVGALPADPLGLGAARLAAEEAPVWHLAISIEAPRGWTLARRARGIGGARIVDDQPGRRQWQYRADAVAVGRARLRVSRAEGMAGFARIAQAALRDHLRAFPGQPTCADARHAEALARAIICARDGADMLFLRSAGRPALSGPVDLADFDAIAQSLPSWAETGLRLDGSMQQGRAVVEQVVELTPAQPSPPAFELAGPCGAGPVAPTGTIQTRIDVRLRGLQRDPPHARRTTAGPLSHTRHVERTASGWRVMHRLSWTNLSAVPPARLAAACRQLARP